MCQRHQNATQLVQQFSDTLYPAVQQLLQQTVVEHGGIAAVDAEQRLLSLLIITKEKVDQLIKYDTQLVMPALEQLEHRTKDQSPQINIGEVNMLFRSMIQKLTLLTQQAISIQPQIIEHTPFTRSIFDFFFYMEHSFLVAYRERNDFFAEWQQKCKCLKVLQPIQVEIKS